MKSLFFLAILISTSCSSQPAAEKIVLVNVGNSGREALANLISSVQKLRPKVIALDFQLSVDKNPEIDNTLIEALGKCKNLVMVSIIDDYSATKLFHSKFIPGCLPKFTKNAKTGFANVIVEDDGYLRRFSQWEFVDGRNEYSFPLQTAYLYDSIKAKEYMLKHSNYNTVNFKDGIRRFKRLSIEDFLTGRVNENDVAGKIVMIGFLGPGDTDKFSAPIPGSSGLNIYGLEFHAQVVSQILQF